MDIRFASKLVVEMKLKQLLFVLRSRPATFDVLSLCSPYTAHSPFEAGEACHLDSALVVHFQVILPC